MSARPVKTGIEQRARGDENQPAGPDSIWGSWITEELAETIFQAACQNRGCYYPVPSQNCPLIINFARILFKNMVVG